MSMTPRMMDVPKRLTTPLIAALDAALPECFWKRKFMTTWQEVGIDAAYIAWSRGPILNPSFIPQVEQAILSIKEWPCSG